MEPPSAVTEPTTTTTTTTTISRRRDRSSRDLETVREEASRLGVALEAAREEVERLTTALEAERAAVRALRRERDRDLRAVREQEAARGRTALCDLRGRFERELDDAVRRAKEATARELGAELNRALRERDAEARREAEAARAREEDLRAQLRLAAREVATATSHQHQPSNSDHLEAELAALRARCRELEEKLRILAEADRRKAADLREQHEHHEVEMAALRKASQQETVRLLEELRSKDRAISQLGREASLQAGRAEESRGRLLDKQCQHCEERERRIMKRASDTRDKRQLLRKLREDDQNNNNKNHRRNADTTQEEEVNTTTTSPAVEQSLRLQLEEKEKIIVALQAAEQEKSKKLDQLTKRHRKEQMRHYYRQFMELEPVVEQEEDSGADSPSPSLSPQPSPVLWGTAEGSEYAALLRDHVELQGEYAALQAKRLRLEHELASARMHSREMRRMAAEHTGGGAGQGCADRMKTLQAEVDDLREQNELLEFRILELEEYGNRDSHTSLRSPDTRDVWTDTESDSGIQSLSDLQEIDLEIKRQELKSRVLNLAATASNVEDRSCLQQVLALLENYEQRLEVEGRVLGSHLELGEHPSKISTRRIVAKVLPFTDLQEIPDVEDEGEQGVRRQQLKNAECLQESGIFEESPTEFVTQGTQTEDSPYFPGLLKCVGSVGELGEELRRLNEIRELVEERGRGDCEPLRITASHLKELAYCRERLQLLEDKVLIYESSGDQQTRLLSERLQREVKLAQQVKELSSKVVLLEAENKRLEEERCELEEAENDTRLRCQKLEAKLVALGERKSELQLQLTQAHREIDRLKSIMAENERRRSNQMSYLESMISKYEQRNYELEERAMDLNTRIDLLESSLPAIIMFNMFQVMQNENVPRKELTSALSASLVKVKSRTVQKSHSAILEQEWTMERDIESFIFPPKDSKTFMKKDPSVEQMSVCSELQCLRKLQDLIQSEAMLKKRIMELERKETVYMETLQQADALWSDMETSYKHQISKSEQNEALMREKVKQLTQCAVQGEEALTERLAALEQSETRLLEQVRLLENDKNSLGKQLEEARIAFENCSSELEALRGNVEGPLKAELTKERANCRELLRTLEEKEQEIQKSVDHSKTEIHGLKMQLNKAYRELVDSECTCSELKEEVETLEMKVSELKISLEEQKQKEELLMIQLSQAILKQEEELEKTKQELLTNTTLQDELKEVQMLTHPESSKGGKFCGASADDTAASKVGVISLGKGKPDDLEKDYLWTKYISDPSNLNLEELEESTTQPDFTSSSPEMRPAPKVETIMSSSVLCYKVDPPPRKISSKMPTKADEEDFWSKFYSDPCSKKLEEDFIEAAYKPGYHHPREGRKAISAVLVYVGQTGCKDCSVVAPSEPPDSSGGGGGTMNPLGQCKIKCHAECACHEPSEEAGRKVLPPGQCNVKCHAQCACHPDTEREAGHPGGEEPVEWTRHIGNPCTAELDEDLDELAQMAGFTRPGSDAAPPPSGGAGPAPGEQLLPVGQCKVKCNADCMCHKDGEAGPQGPHPGGDEHSEWTRHIGNPCTTELDEDLDELAQMAGFTRPGSGAPAAQHGSEAAGSAPAGSLLPVGQCKGKCNADCVCHTDGAASPSGGEAPHPGGDEHSEWTRHIGNPCTVELDEDLDELAQMAGFTRPGSGAPAAQSAGSAPAGSLLPVGQCKEKCNADCLCHTDGGQPGAAPHPGGDEHSEWTRHIGNPCTVELDEDLDELAQMAGFTRPGSGAPAAQSAGSAPAGSLLPVGQCKEKCNADCLCHTDGGQPGAAPHPGGDDHSEWTRHIGNPCTAELDEDLDELAQMAGFTRPGSGAPAAQSAGSAPAGSLLPVGQCKEKCNADCLCHTDQAQSGGQAAHPGGDEHSEWTRHIGNPCTAELDEDLDELAQMAGFTRPGSGAPAAQPAGSAPAGSLLPVGQCKEKCNADCLCHTDQAQSGGQAAHPGGDEHSEWTRHIGNPCTAELDEDLDELAQMAGFTRPGSGAPAAQPGGSAPAGSLLPKGQCKEKCNADCLCHTDQAQSGGQAAHPGGDEHSEWTRHIGNPCTAELDEDLDELAQMAGFTRPGSGAPAAQPGGSAPAGSLLPVGQCKEKCNADCLCHTDQAQSGGQAAHPGGDEHSEWTRHIGNPCTAELDEDLDELAQMAGFTRPGSGAPAAQTGAGVSQAHAGATSAPCGGKCSADCVCDKAHGGPPPPAGEEPVEWTRHIGNPCTAELDEDLDELAQMAGFTRPGSGAAPASPPASSGGAPPPPPPPMPAGEEPVEWTRHIGNPCTAELDEDLDELAQMAGFTRPGSGAPAAPTPHVGAAAGGKCKKCKKDCTCLPTATGAMPGEVSGDAMGGRFSFESAYVRVSAEDFPFGEQGSMILSPMRSLVTFTDSQMAAAFEESPVFPPEEGEEASKFMLEEAYGEGKGVPGAPGGAPGAPGSSACRVFCWSEESGLVPIPAAVDDPTSEECKVFCWEEEGAGGAAPPAEGGEEAAAEEAPEEAAAESEESPAPAVEAAPPAAGATDSGCEVFCWEGHGETVGGAGAQAAPEGAAEEGAIQEISVEITIEEKGEEEDQVQCVCTDAEASPEGAMPSKQSSCGVFCWAGASHPGAMLSSFSPCSSVFCWEGHPPPPINFDNIQSEAPADEESADEFHDVEETIEGGGEAEEAKPGAGAAAIPEEASSEEVASSTLTEEEGEESKGETDIEEEEKDTATTMTPVAADRIQDDSLCPRFSFESAYVRVSAEDFPFGEQGSMILSPMRSLVTFTDSQMAAAFEESPVFPPEEGEEQAVKVELPSAAIPPELPSAAIPPSVGAPTRKLLPKGTCKKKCHGRCTCGQKDTATTMAPVAADHIEDDSLCPRFSFESAYVRVSAEDFPFGEQGSMILSPMRSLVTFTDSQMAAAFEESPVFPPEEGEEEQAVKVELPSAASAAIPPELPSAEIPQELPSAAAIPQELPSAAIPQELPSAAIPPSVGAPTRKLLPKGTCKKKCHGRCTCGQKDTATTMAPVAADHIEDDSLCPRFSFESAYVRVSAEDFPFGEQGSMILSPMRSLVTFTDSQMAAAFEESPVFPPEEGEEEQVVEVQLPSAEMPQEVPSAEIPQELPSAAIPQELPSAAIPQELPSAAIPQEPPSAAIPPSVGAPTRKLLPKGTCKKKCHGRCTCGQKDTATTMVPVAADRIEDDSLCPRFSFESAYVRVSAEDFPFGEQGSMILSPMRSLVTFTDSQMAAAFEESPVFPPEEGEEEQAVEVELPSAAIPQEVPSAEIPQELPSAEIPQELPSAAIPQELPSAAIPPSVEAPTRKLLPKGTCKKKCHGRCTCGQKVTATTMAPVAADRIQDDSLCPRFSFESAYVRVSAEDFPFGEQGSMILSPMRSLVTFTDSQMAAAFEESPVFPPEEGEEEQAVKVELPSAAIPQEPPSAAIPQELPLAAIPQELPSAGIPPSVEKPTRKLLPKGTCKKKCHGRCTCGQSPGSGMKPQLEETVAGEEAPAAAPPETPDEQQPSAEDEQAPKSAEGEVQQPPAEGKEVPAAPISSTTVQHFMTDLEEKCRIKDKMISALANELQLRARSHVWKNLLNDLDNVDSPTEPPCDFDEEKLCRYLRKPSDSVMGRSPQRMLSATLTSKLKTESTPTLLVEVKPRYRRKDISKSQEQAEDLQESSTARSARSASDLAIKPHGLHVIRQLEPDSLLLGWNASPHSSLSGFEIYINGVFVHKVHSPTRNKALIRNVNLSSKMVISLYSLTPSGRSSEPTCAVYPDTAKES